METEDQAQTEILTLPGCKAVKPIIQVALIMQGRGVILFWVLAVQQPLVLETRQVVLVNLMVGEVVVLLEIPVLLLEPLA